MARRELWETLVDLLSGFGPPEGSDLLWVASYDLDLPLEVTIHGSASGVVLAANLPAWRWRTAFDRRPARLQLSCGATRVPAGPGLDGAER